MKFSKNITYSEIELCLISSTILKIPSRYVFIIIQNHAIFVTIFLPVNLSVQKTHIKSTLTKISLEFTVYVALHTKLTVNVSDKRIDPL